MSFDTGSDSAFLYESLLFLKEESRYQKTEGRAVAFSMLGMALASLCGGYIAIYGMRINMLFTSIGGLLACIISLTFKEPYSIRKKIFNDSLLNIIPNLIKEYKPKPGVLFVIIYASVLLSYMQVSHRFFQPYLEINDIKIEYFGYVYTVWMLFSSFSAYFASILEKKITFFGVLATFLILVAGSTLYIGNYVNFYGIFIILGAEFVWSAIKPIVYTYINNEITSVNRAITISLIGFLKGLFLLILAPLFGYIADILTFQESLIYQGLSLIIVGSVFLIFVKKYINFK